jgi:uroporphyrinogen decarboxylase
VFESNACELSPHVFTEFALPELVHIATSVRARLAAAGHPGVPLTLFARGANVPFSVLQGAGYDVLSLEWTEDAAAVRAAAGPAQALQGNLDPAVLYGGRETIEREVQRMCAAFRADGRTHAWIANLGHGITPGVDPEDMRWFLECVHKYSAN